LNKAVTLGTLDIGDLNGTHSFTVQSGVGGSLAFEKTSGEASLIKRTGLNDIINANISLLSDLVVSNSSAGELILSGQISGARGITKTGTGKLVLQGTAIYSGATIVSQGTLQVGAATLLAQSSEVQVASG